MTKSQLRITSTAELMVLSAMYSAISSPSWRIFSLRPTITIQTR